MSCAVGERAGWLINSWARQGRTLQVPDAIIAATALEHDLTLMTANRRDFPMPELKFYPA
jgi:predicted nucleic acid-binding protein